MKKARQLLRSQRGETIVEVLVSFVLLMLFMALFTAALRYTRRASQQAQLTRDTAYTLTGQIYPVDNGTVTWQAGGTKDLHFGSTFSVKDVQLQTFTADDGAGRTHTFTRYYKEDTTP